MSSQEETPQDRAASRTANATIWIAIFTVVAVLVGISQFIVFRRQLDVMQGQLTEMISTGKQADLLIEANTRLADAAIKQSEAASKANEIANNAGMQANRPMVGISRTDTVGTIGINLPFGAKAYTRNSGRSPALNMRGQFIMKIAPSSFLGKYDLKESKPGAGSQSILHAEGELGWFVGPLSGELMRKELIQSIEHGTTIIALYGRVDYSDSFHKRYVTKICQYYDRIFHTFVSCPTGNSAT